MTRIPRSAAGVIAVAVLALAAAGCGGKDTTASDAYVGQVNAIQTQLVSTYQRLASEITASSASSADAVTFDKLQKALAISVARLRAVKPPQKVRSQHADLAGALDAYRGELSAAADDLTSGDSARATKARTALEQQTTTLSDTFTHKITEINAKLQG